MKIKINVVNGHEETSVQDENYLGQQVHTISQPVHVGDVLLIKVRNKLFKCEVQDSEAYKSSISLFSVKIYPLDEDDKKLFENDEYRIVKKRDYMDGTLNFYKEIKHKNGDAYWEIDFTKGDIQFEWPTDTFVKAFDEIPFTVVKFLTKSVPSSAVQDNDLTEYRNSIKPEPKKDKGTEIRTAIGQPVHVGDVLLIKVRNNLWECEIVDKKVFKRNPDLFTARLYPLYKEDKKVLENNQYNWNSAKRKYEPVMVEFNKTLIGIENDKYHWEIDFTKGLINLYGHSKFLLTDSSFTVVKFLRKSIPGSAVQDNDLTEYKPSIKPLKEDYRNVFNPSQAIGEPVEDGDTFLIEAADKSFKCEIHETDDLFKNHQNLFTARIYPLDKDDVSIAYEDYFEVVLIFDQHLENHDHYVIDFTKGKISPVDYIPIIREDTPFTVTKFLAHSDKTSTVQDHNLDLTYISKDLNRFVADCLEFKELVEDYKKTIEECIEDDQRSVELDGYDGEDPVESPNKKYLEMITFCIDDVTYNIDELIDQIRKR